MTDDLKIRTAELSLHDQANEFTVSVDFWRGPNTMSLAISHTNLEIQAIGRDGFERFCEACGVSNPEDTSDFLGKMIPREAWAEVRHAAVLQREAIQRRLAPPKQKDPPSRRADPPESGRYVYVISCTDSDAPLCKIGIANSPEKRLKELSTASPHQLRVEAAMYSPQAAAVERAAHNHFADLRRNGEWFGMPASDAIRFVHSQVLEGAV